LADKGGHVTLSKRERSIAIVFLICAGVFTIDRLGLSPYLERRRALLDQSDAKILQVSEQRQVLQREQALRRLLKKLGKSVESDPSAAEGQFLHVLHEWEQQSGVAKPSFARVHAIEIQGYTHLTFQVSANGPMGAVALLIYRLETAAIPLRVDDVQVTPKNQGGDELQVQLKVSTLCRTNGVTPTAPPTERPSVRTGEVAQATGVQ
jgi:hypothetical protein